MGIYDTIYLKMRCPYCKEVSEMDFQTKDGNICMHNYKVGDVFQNGQFRRINAIGSCNSLTCQLEAAKESVWTSGYYGGFTRSFDAYIYCDLKGRITNKIKIYQLNNHKGIMHGKLGELKGKDNNMKVVKYSYFDKNNKWIKAKMKPMITNGWLDKFREEYRENYGLILYLFNLEDGEEAFKLWFIFRHKFDKIIKILKKQFKIKDDEVFASIFLSNSPEKIYKLGDIN